MIVFDRASKTYPDGTTAVDGLSLTIDEGTVTVFVGPSGCGKTTSMRMINKMVVPTSGRVLVDGTDIADADPVRLRLGMGYVIQHGGLLPHRTVLDNVASILRLKGAGRREARAAARTAMARVRLDPGLADRYPAQLSGGQQQRVGVARGLAADPNVLLMDEPFGAVDPIVRAELQQELLRLQRELGKTVVFVTHDIDEAFLLGDRIAVFAPGGEMVQHADAETVLTRPANEFVARLIGRDRGFRALSFRALGGAPILPLGPREPAGHGPDPASGPWRLDVDEAGRPTRWRRIDGDDAPVPVGTLAAADGSLRRALDAVLSSPAGLGPVVDAAGALTGFVTADAVRAAIDRREPDGRP